MRCEDTKEFDIQLRIFDFDGTIYPNPDVLNDHVYQKMFRHLKRNGAASGLTLKEIKELGLMSYKAHGHSAVGLAEAFNIVMHDLYDGYHKLMNPQIIKTTRQDNENIREFCRHALAIGERVRNCILTHSTVDWTYPSLQLLNQTKSIRDLNKVFNKKSGNIFTAEDYRFEDSNGNITQYLKSGSFIPFLTTCAEMGIDPRSCAMFEDSLSNLKIAKMLGMQTVFVYHGQPLELLPDYVDHQIDSVAGVSQIPLTHGVSTDEGFNLFVDRLMDEAKQVLAKSSPQRIVDCDQFPKPRNL